MNNLILKENTAPENVPQIYVIYDESDTTPPGWTGFFYHDFEGSIPGKKYWVINVNNVGEVSGWLSANGKGKEDIIGDFNQTGITNDWFSLNNPDFEFAVATLLILVGLGFLTGAAFLDLVITALIIAGLYIVVESVKSLKDLLKNAFGSIIPDSVKKWLNENFPGGYDGFITVLEARVIDFYRIISLINILRQKNEKSTS